MYIEFQFINSKSKIFDDVTNLKNSTSKKVFEVEILSRDCERTLTSDIEDSYGLTGLHDSGIRGLVFSPSL